MPGPTDTSKTPNTTPTDKSQQQPEEKKEDAREALALQAWSKPDEKKSELVGAPPEKKADVAAPE